MKIEGNAVACDAMADVESVPCQIHGPRNGHMRCAFDMNDLVVLTLIFYTFPHAILTPACGRMLECNKSHSLHF